MATKPASVMTTEITVAKIGRSMKKREITLYSPADAPAVAVPALDVPALEAPALEAPALQAPDVGAPAVAAPAVAAPGPFSSHAYRGRTRQRARRCNRQRWLPRA